MFSNEHIHHYTTIDTLALILRNRTIRFNRLDRVDDVSESQTASRIQFGKYYFVSCWTHSHEESIPQWHMYTDLMSGVRISLPRKMFKMRSLVPNPEWNSVSKGTILSPVPFSKIFYKNFYREWWFILLHHRDACQLSFSAFRLFPQPTLQHILCHKPT